MHLYTHDTPHDPKCEDCNYPLEASTGPTAAGPAAGDVSICGNCGLVMEFDADFRLVKSVDPAILNHPYISGVRANILARVTQRSN